MKSITVLIVTLFIGLNILSGQSFIEDNDGDTSIKTEPTTDADIIEFKVEGTRRWKMIDDRIEPMGTSPNLNIGYRAGRNTTSYHNTFIGNYCGESNTSGGANTALGKFALRYSASSSHSTAIGNNSLSDYNASNGGSNTAVGYSSAQHLTGGIYNVFMGNRCAENMTNGYQNVILGSYAAKDKTTGNNNVILGYRANRSGGSGSGNIIIGYNAGESETGSNKLYVENSSSTDPLIYGEFDNDKLTINGFATVDRLDGAEEVARFVSQSEPQITLYRGTNHAGDLQHYKQDIVLTNRENTGNVLVQTTNGGSTSVAAAFYADGDLDVSGDRIYFGNTEYLQDAGWRRIETNASIQPSTCGYRDLGSSANRWDQVYIDNAVLVASCFSSGGGSSGSAMADGQSDQYGLAEIMELKSVQGYKDKSNEITVTQLQEVMPGLVEEYDEVLDEKTEEITLVPSENPSIRITDFIPVLVKSVQEQNIVMQKQEEMIDMLISELSDMRRSIEHLESELYRQTTEKKSNADRVSVTCKPNPANDLFTITYGLTPTWETAELRLTDMNGRVLLSKPISQDQSEIQINTSNYSSGSYICSIVKNGVIHISEKLMIMH